MSEEIKKYESDKSLNLEKLVTEGDLSALTPQERLQYYTKICDLLGLNPLTKPFEYLILNKKLVLYATKSCTEQLRKIHGVSVRKREVDTTFKDKGVYTINVEVEDKTGRTDIGTGSVYIGNLQGNELCNALMKAETKAKRRATLSICGLGFLDESEIETLPPDTKKISVETAHSETISINNNTQQLTQLQAQEQAQNTTRIIEEYKEWIGSVYSTDMAHSVLYKMKSDKELAKNTSLKKTIWKYFIESLSKIGLIYDAKNDTFVYERKECEKLSNKVKLLLNKYPTEIIAKLWNLYVSNNEYAIEGKDHITAPYRIMSAANQLENIDEILDAILNHFDRDVVEDDLRTIL